MQKDAIYYKARLDAIEQIIIEEKGSDRTEKNNPASPAGRHSVLLRNGIVPNALKDRYDKAFTEHHKAWLRSGNKQELSFSDLTRFNTWFELHPEKVAGKEVITTSLEFPISIKGSDTTILTTITKTLQSKYNELTMEEKNRKSMRKRLVRARAASKLKLLELLKM